MISARDIWLAVQSYVRKAISEFYYDGGMTIWNDGTQVGTAFRYRCSGSVTATNIIQAATTGGYVKAAIANSDMPMGIALQAGEEGDYIWVMAYGKAVVTFAGGVTPTAGNIAYVSGTAGLANNSATLPSVELHNREIGHVVSTGTAGGTALVQLHYN